MSVKRQKLSVSKYSKEIIVSLISVFASVMISQILLPINMRKQSRQDVKKDLFVREAPILNRVYSIWKESSRTHLMTVRTIEEVQPCIYNYIEPSGNVVKSDTVTNITFRNDTSEIDIPRFACFAASANIVIDDISFIRSHTDLLSTETYPSVKALVSSFETHPIDVNAGIDSTWINDNLQKEYYRIVGDVFKTG